MTYTPCGCEGWRWLMGPFADSGAFDLMAFKKEGKVCSIPAFVGDEDPVLIHFCPFCGKKVWDDEGVDE